MGGGYYHPLIVSTLCWQLLLFFAYFRQAEKPEFLLLWYDILVFVKVFMILSMDQPWKIPIVWAFLILIIHELFYPRIHYLQFCRKNQLANGHIFIWVNNSCDWGIFAAQKEIGKSHTEHCVLDHIKSMLKHKLLLKQYN